MRDEEAEGRDFDTADVEGRRRRRPNVLVALLLHVVCCCMLVVTSLTSHFVNSPFVFLDRPHSNNDGVIVVFSPLPGNLHIRGLFGFFKKPLNLLFN